ncbi:unnamed protein product [Brachionus calyciflorus]|uniref:Uncharacterized protein n=1 Tax=Brachionus calyciflorus TaxID=104777 RepID=A0A814JI22_9BILA|nr:unnamed protein product [Brachionus calyciflorus]
MYYVRKIFICNKFRPSDSSTTTGGEQRLGPGCQPLVLAIMLISVKTLGDDDSDFNYENILDENYIISFIDPNKCCKCIEYNSPSNEVKFEQMIYCYGKN